MTSSTASTASTDDEIDNYLNKVSKKVFFLGKSQYNRFIAKA